MKGTLYAVVFRPIWFVFVSGPDASSHLYITIALSPTGGNCSLRSNSLWNFMIMIMIIYDDDDDVNDNYSKL